MLTKFVLAFSLLALATAFAGGSPTKGATYKIILTQPAVVLGTSLKAGEYRLNVNSGTATFTLNKESQTVPVKVEIGKIRYNTDQVQYDKDGDHTKISEICVGGTKTRLIFN